MHSTSALLVDWSFHPEFSPAGDSNGMFWADTVFKRARFIRSLKGMDILKYICLVLMLWRTIDPAIGQENLWRAENGVIKMKSDAPLELIAAQSNALRGIIDPQHKSFAFTVRINSFEGFNSETQQTHFLENYMEHRKYPNATFSGKFIEDIPFDQPGTYTVRAKGMLEIHGISKERIIKGTLMISPGQRDLKTTFTVPVIDHGITIPKIVMQKIAEEIDIDVIIRFDTVPE
jgi:hypothetical protein